VEWSPGTSARPRRRRGAGAAVLLLALLAFTQVWGPQASLNILWRFTVLSFDDPASQVLDELALETTSFADAQDEVLAVTRLAAMSARRTPLVRSDGFATSEVLSGRIGRSPPLS
jgi:hypothetical protein